MKVHTVQLRKLPRPHSRGVHRLLGFMPTIATAGLSSLSQITYTAHRRGPTAALPGGFVCVCQHLLSIRGPLPAHFSQTMQTILYVDLSLALPPVDPFSKSLRTHPDDANIDPNSSEVVDTMLTQTHPALLPNCSPYSSRTCPVDVSFG